MICARKECGLPATCKITIRVPPKGHGFDHCATMSPGLFFCRKHAEEETAQTWLTDAARASIEALVAGRVPPDFKRAQVVVTGLD